MPQHIFTHCFSQREQCQMGFIMNITSYIGMARKKLISSRKDSNVLLWCSNNYKKNKNMFYMNQSTKWTIIIRVGFNKTMVLQAYWSSCKIYCLAKWTWYPCRLKWNWTSSPSYKVFFEFFALRNWCICFGDRCA